MKSTIIKIIVVLAFINETLNGSDQTQSILINSIPKSGTHLLSKCVTLLTGMKAQREVSVEGLVPDKSTIPQTIKNVFYVTHAFYNEKNLEIIKKNNYHVLFIYRDPRDVAVSMAHWMRKKPLDSIALIPNLELINDDELLTKCINYTRQLFAQWHLWKQNKAAHLIRFEDLVGTKGGGSHRAQLRAIKGIARHLKLRANKKKIKAIAQILFGGTPTFRKGQIGVWRTTFNSAHIKLAHELMGKLIINMGYEKDSRWACQ